MIVFLLELLMMVLVTKRQLQRIILAIAIVNQMCLDAAVTSASLGTGGFDYRQVDVVKVSVWNLL